MYKVIVFDMDGTLIDSDDIVIKTWIELLKLYKPADFKIDLDILRTYSGPSLEKTVVELFPPDYQAFIYDEYRLRTKKYYETDLRIFANEVKILKKLYDDGYKLAIFTSKNREMTNYCLDRFNLRKYFSYFVTVEDVKNPKPDFEGLIKIKNHFKFENNDILYVGDTKFDAICCNNYGVNCCLMNILPRNYEGYDKKCVVCLNFDELYKEIKNHDNK